MVQLSLQSYTQLYTATMSHRILVEFALQKKNKFLSHVSKYVNRNRLSIIKFGLKFMFGLLIRTKFSLTENRYVSRSAIAEIRKTGIQRLSHGSSKVHGRIFPIWIPIQLLALQLGSSFTSNPSSRSSSRGLVRLHSTLKESSKSSS